MNELPFVSQLRMEMAPPDAAMQRRDAQMQVSTRRRSAENYL